MVIDGGLILCTCLQLLYCMPQGAGGGAGKGCVHIARGSTYIKGLGFRVFISGRQVVVQEKASTAGVKMQIVLPTC